MSGNSHGNTIIKSSGAQSLGVLCIRLRALCVYFHPTECGIHGILSVQVRMLGLKRVRTLQKVAHLMHDLAFSDCRPCAVTLHRATLMWRMRLKMLRVYKKRKLPIGEDRLCSDLGLLEWLVDLGKKCTFGMS